VKGREATASDKEREEGRERRTNENKDRRRINKRSIKARRNESTAGDKQT
jgi:hypothetical protein